MYLSPNVKQVGIVVLAVAFGAAIPLLVRLHTSPAQPATTPEPTVQEVVKEVRLSGAVAVTFPGGPTPPPQPPPQPPPPVPPPQPQPSDPFAASVQDAYAADPDTAGKSLSRSQLAAIYRQGALIVSNQALTTVGQVHDLMAAATADARVSLDGSKLRQVRRAIAEEMNKVLPRSSGDALTPASRATFATQFNRVATVLEGLK